MTIALRSELLSRAGFAHGFSLRTGGVSEAPFATLNLGGNVGDAPAAVAENKRRLALALGHDPARLFEVSQVHGSGVRVVGPGDNAPDVRRRDAANPRVDLVAILRAQLASRGVAADHVDDVGGCTRCEPARFFSY